MMNQPESRLGRLVGPLLSFACSLAFAVGFANGQEIPRPEHPVPTSVRPHWLNLNGTWQFRFDPDDRGVTGRWFEGDGAGFDRRIVVPFAWESELSGLAAIREPSKIGWYRRAFRVPESFPRDQRVWLHFQAVDWRADVWVNGKKVGEHEGGYTPFAIDVNDAIDRGAENTIVLRAHDPTDPALPTGKQVGWYTTSSGIWQTVWLEARPAAQVRSFTIRTSIDPAEIVADVEVAADPTPKPATYTLTLRSTDPTVGAASYQFGATPEADRRITRDGNPTARRLGGPEALRFELKVPVRDARLWSPDSPHLYPLTLELKPSDAAPADVVETYAGLRTIARGKLPGEDFERVFLNGKPIYLRGALDQSFNPRGIYTAPTDEFLRNDIKLAQTMGLNFLRIHIKPDEPRRLYWADKLGMLIMEDMPNAWKQNPQARTAWEATMREVLPRDRNHPSIFSWVAFNETWGLGSPPDYKKDQDTQSWVKRMVAAIRELDPTRLVEDNSPCNYDHVEGSDLNSWHFYIDDHEKARAHVDEVVARSVPGSDFNYCPGEKMNSAPLINSEYGSVSAGGGDRDVSWGFRDLTTLLRKQPRIQGYVYTELTDIEWEHNGFADYDRSPKQFGYDAFVPGMTPADLQGADFVGYDAPPVIVAKVGETVRVPWFVSHYSELPKATLRWWLIGHNDDGEEDRTNPRELPVQWSPYAVTAQPKSIGFRLLGPWVGALAFELVGPDGQRIAANFVNVVIQPETTAPRVERRDDRTLAIRFRPDEFANRKWAGYPARQPEGKAQGLGKGRFEYRIRVPRSAAAAHPETAQLLLEVSGRAGRDQVDWNTRVNRQDNPQTDARPAPSDLKISIQDEPVAAVELVDDPADARGILSHLARTDHGSFGEKIRLEFPLSAKAREAITAGQPLRIRLEVPDDADHPGGLAIFGESTGRYPFDPTLTLITRDDLPNDLGVKPDDSAAVDSAVTRARDWIVPGDAPQSKQPTTWAYVNENPGEGWKANKFDDASWTRAVGGFGTDETPGIRVRTAWKSPEIWLRTVVDLPKIQADDVVQLRIFHDEDVEVFVNGRPIFQARGYLTDYREVILRPDQLARFQPGKNVIAVHCRQTGGGQGVDLGLRITPGQPAD